jgi:hypothetical protein
MKDWSHVGTGGAGALSPSIDHDTLSPFSTGVNVGSPVGAQVTASTTVRLDQAALHVRTGGAQAHGLPGRLLARRELILALFGRVEPITAACMIMIGSGRTVRIGAYQDTIGAAAHGTATISIVDARGREMAGRFFALDNRSSDFWSVVWRPHFGTGDKGPQDLTSGAVTGSMYSIISGDAIGAGLQIAVIGSARVRVRSNLNGAGGSGKKDQPIVGAMTLG